MFKTEYVIWGSKQKYKVLQILENYLAYVNMLERLG